MMRHTAIDMENSENLLGPSGNSLFCKSRRKCITLSCILILSHLLTYGIGFTTGNIMNNCDGSQNKF